jgi:hypothetical protein
MANNFPYFFRFNNESWEMPHADYLQNEELCKIVRNPEFIHFFCGRTILSFDPRWLSDQPKVQAQLRALEQEQRSNPLRFYAPNSREQLDFLNDTDGTSCALVDLNRSGKTTAAWIKMLVGQHPMIKADPSWEIFADHGVKYHEFRGAISVGVATYNTAKLMDPMWTEQIKKWTPDAELGKYRRFNKKRGHRYAPNWGHDKSIQLAESKTMLGFYTYEMDQGNYEGGALKKWLWDEQGRQAMWNGADRGTRTTDGVHYFSLTPHKVEGRPDTGGAGWMYPFLTGKKTYGHNVKAFSGTQIWDIPDWIYPDKQKRMEVEKWEGEPQRIQTETGVSQRKILAEGRARLYGEWHTTSDVVLDEWQPEHSWIDPLWEKPPKDLTLYRAMDHGINNPTVCLWFAVDRDANIFLYRAYYNTGVTIGENVQRIIEASGNERVPLGVYRDGKSGMSFDQYEERYVGEHYASTVMDSRSFALPDKMCGKPHGWIYKQAGLTGIKKAAGKFSSHWIPLFQEMLYVDPKRVHPVTGKMGSPRLFVFNVPENTKFKYEIEHYFWKPHKEGEENPKSEPHKKNDHGINAAAYGLMTPMTYRGYHGEPEDHYSEGHRDQMDFVTQETDDEYRSMS